MLYWLWLRCFYGCSFAYYVWSFINLLLMVLMLIFLIYAYVVILTAVTYYKYGVVSSIIHMCTCSLTWLKPHHWVKKISWPHSRWLLCHIFLIFEFQFRLGLRPDLAGELTMLPQVPLVPASSPFPTPRRLLRLAVDALSVEAWCFWHRKLNSGGAP